MPVLINCKPSTCSAPFCLPTLIMCIIHCKENTLVTTGVGGANKKRILRRKMFLFIILGQKQSKPLETSVFLQFITVILGRQSITRNSSFIPNHTRNYFHLFAKTEDI